MNYFPLFADLTGRPVLVVGGGSVAARKVGCCSKQMLKSVLLLAN